MTGRGLVVSGGQTSLIHYRNVQMPGIARKTRLHSQWTWLLLLLLPLQAVSADEALQRRVLVGLKLFPAVLAASQELGPKSELRDIKVLIVYHGEQDHAEELAEILRDIKQIKGKPLVVETSPINQLLQRSGAPPFGLFVSQRNDKDIEIISRYGQQHNIITFSPFQGDVENGILAGIAISDRILPYINSQTLATLPAGLKAFFLKVAEIYEP